MPQFHQMMGERLRSVEQGADTVVWLAVSRAAGRTRSGLFFQGEFFYFPQSSEASSDGPFVLQIVRWFQPTCLWPGLTALLKKFRIS